MLRTLPRLRAVRTTTRAPYIRLPPRAQIYPFGVAENPQPDDVLLQFPEEGWKVDAEGKEGWAIVGDAEGRRLAVETVLGRHKITPTTPDPGPLPVATLPTPRTAVDRDSWAPVRYLAFARPSTTGEFTDYTARYGALQDEDKLSLRHKLERSFGEHARAQAHKNVFAAVDLMGLKHYLDMPAIALSSGQTRRARIAQAIMTEPAVLMLEDPMAGLDVPSRALVDKLLGQMNAEEDRPRVVLVLRDKGKDTLGSWVTNVVEVRGGEVWVGSREEWEARRQEREQNGEGKGLKTVDAASKTVAAEPVAQLRDVSVSYGEGTREVLSRVNWVIRPGDRWHLQGANGSGKTTLLAVLLGHHPQSYSLPATNLTLFSQPRRKVATPVLRSLIGHTSPEIYAAFPRNMGHTAIDTIGTGYEGVFSRRGLSKEQKDRVLYLLDYFKPFLATTRTGKPAPEMTTRDIALKPFAHYMPPQQALLVFLRALVSRPPMLVLDEPTQGMDERIWARCRELLAQEWEEMRAEGKEQAVVMVSHYEDEVPWTGGKILRLTNGKGEVLDQ